MTKMAEEERHTRLLKTIDGLLLNDDIGKYKSDAIALYYAYSHSADEQSNLSPLKVPGAAELLEVSTNRIRTARKILLRLNLITPFSKQDENGVMQHFVKVHSV